MAPPLPEERAVRVLHVIANLDIGGAQEVVRSLAPALLGCGVQTSVLTFRDGPLREALQEDGVPVHVVPGRSRSLVRDVRAWGEVLRLRNEVSDVVREQRIDVVQTHLLRSLDFLMLGVGTRSRRPSVVWTFHNARLDLRRDQLPAGDRTFRIKRRAYRQAYHAASRLAAALVAVSSEVGESVAREIQPPPGRLEVIPNGVNVDRYGVATERSAVRDSMGVPREAVLVTCVAKMYEQKGHEVLLQAFSELPTAPDVHLALVGDGPLRSSLTQSLEATGMADRVHLTGVRSDIPSVLGASDVFVLPSLWEGLPMALLEAMAGGLPVIASRVSGTDEVLAGTDAGLLVQPGDASGLRLAMERLILDPDLRRQLGTAARARVAERYSVTAQARAHAELYGRCLARRRRGA